mmetsp:Transcript_12396/g.15820  ORF Transcript_12396/g.15820 Transcript_12396/m.15820 type:complete len:231 (-) Transcript_12396:709-1401(-)
MALKSAAVVTVCGFLTRGVRSNDPPADPKYTPYYVKEAGNASYSAQISDVAKYYAKPIDPNNPGECFGENFEVYEQLQSPEWQLCQVGGQMHICATDSPSDLLLFWMKNDVQEDSFQINLRRKTKRVPTNFFLTETDREYVQKVCPVDNNYAQADTRCSGSYVNGAFVYYPTFTDACQCKEMAGTMRFNVNDIKEEKVVTNPASPCMMQLQNIQRENSSKPNIWSQMHTI